jgi:hypothetical protein
MILFCIGEGVREFVVGMEQRDLGTAARGEGGPDQIDQVK